MNNVLYQAQRNDYNIFRMVGAFLLQTDIIRAIARLIEFYKHESCGQCTPCREGTYHYSAPKKMDCADYNVTHIESLKL